MKLYLLQHADAFSSEQYKDRPLTEQGYLQAMKITDHIRPLSLSIDLIWHSGKTRAFQTAKIIRAAAKNDVSLETQSGLSPTDDPKLLAEKIQGLRKNLMIVGHLPFLSRLAGLLLTGNSDTEPIAFQKAGLVCLEHNEPGTWQLCWMLTPDLL